MWKAFWAWVWTQDKNLLALALPFLKSTTMAIIADPEVQAVAKGAIQAAVVKFAGSGDPKVGDAKFKAALADTQSVLLNRGRDIAIGKLAAAVQWHFEDAVADGSLTVPPAK